MDNMQWMYLLGALFTGLLGFVIAWFLGRRGLQHDLQACRTKADALNRSLDEQKQAAVQLEAQVEQGQSDLATSRAEQQRADAQMAAAQRELVDANSEIARLRAAVEEGEAERVTLEAELAQRSASYAQAYSQIAELTAATAAAAEVNAAALAAAEATVQAEAAEIEALEQATNPLETEVEVLTGEIKALQAELEAVRASTTRINTESAIRAKLLPAGPDQYVDVVSDPDRATAALRERDLTIVATQSAADYVRRDMGFLSAAGADLANALDKRNREYEILLAYLSELTAIRPKILSEYAAVTARLPLGAATGLLPGQVELGEATKELATGEDFSLGVTAPKDRHGELRTELAEFKAGVVNAAIKQGGVPKITETPQDLADVHGIGSVFEQRLYDVGVGTYWELAQLSDQQLVSFLQIGELQLLHMNLDAIRADALRLARTTDTVSLIWEGEQPDDFEPIKGIGKVFEQRLYAAGIRTYKTLANTTVEQLAAVCQARKPLEPNYAGWIQQARAWLSRG